MKRWLLALLFSLLATVALAQPKTPAAVNGCVYYSSLLSPTTGQTVTFTCGANGELLTGLIVGGAEVSGSNPLPISGSFSANLGGFAPGGSYATPLSVTNSTGNVALPTGTVVVVYNVGANAAYVKLGTSNAVTATTADDYIPSGGAIALTVGSNTYLAAITASSTTTLNLSGGAGLFTGLSGVGGGGSGGTVTQGTAGSAGSAWYVQPGTGATWAATESGTWNVGLSTGSNAIGSITNTTFAATESGTWTVQPGNTANTTPWVITPWIGGAVNSATNGLYVNLLQGNAVVAAGNPIFATIEGTVPLPTGAATSANQTNATQKTQIVDGSGNVIASTSNNLDVQCANCSGSGVSTADEATYTAGTSLFAGSGGFYQTTPTTGALTTGQQGMFQVTAQRALFTNLRNASGTEIATSSNPLIDTPYIGGAVNSATNGLYFNILQGNAVNASGNPIFAQITTLPALVAGSAIIGKVGIDQTTPGTTNAVQTIAGTTGGATPYHLLSAASTNSTNVKNAAGTLYSISLLNTTATIYYLRFYDSSSAPTCSSSTGVVQNIPIPANAAGAGLTLNLGGVGMLFANGISFCLTGAFADNDNTNAATGVAVNLTYK